MILGKLIVDSDGGIPKDRAYCSDGTPHDWVTLTDEETKSLGALDAARCSRCGVIGFAKDGRFQLAEGNL